MLRMALTFHDVFISGLSILKNLGLAVGGRECFAW